MNYNKQDTMIILNNLIKVFNKSTDENIQLKVEAMILAFQFHLRSF